MDHGDFLQPLRLLHCCSARKWKGGKSQVETPMLLPRFINGRIRLERPLIHSPSFNYYVVEDVVEFIFFNQKTVIIFNMLWNPPSSTLFPAKGARDVEEEEWMRAP